MPKILGIDTGGTYTDGVIMALPEGRVASKSKTPTTPQDLCACIRGCIGSFAAADRAGLHLVCLSTTLATNALVEGRGCTEGLILLGGRPEGRLPTTLIRTVPGKPDILGRIREPLDEQLVDEAIESLRGSVQAVAVSGYASVRNPQHEIFVGARVRQKLGVPTVCAHELTDALGFYDRSVTAALNARLIPLICSLIDAVQQVLREFQISAPLMIVRGDGTLLSADCARDRPIETILSGPAASIAGGLFLSGKTDALILDMGGTTTDTANVTDRQPKLRADGASVGGWFTRVRAAEVYTVGLGGDSRIRLHNRTEFRIGPERALPYCVAAARYPQFAAELERLADDPAQPCRHFWQNEGEAYFLAQHGIPSDEAEQHLYDALADGPHTLYDLRQKTGLADLSPRLDRLVKTGALSRIALTPTDLLHASGDYTVWDCAAARQAVCLRAVQLDLSPDDCLARLRAAISRKLTRTCIEAGFYFDGQTVAANDGFLHYCTDQLLLDDGGTMLQARPALKKPVVAIGAPAAAWTGCIESALHTPVLFPVHAEVAGAVGAAVGHIVERADILIRRDPVTQQFTVFTADSRTAFLSLDEATAFAQRAGQQQARRRLPEGPADISVETEDVTLQNALEPGNNFVERHVRVTAAIRIFPFSPPDASDSFNI